MPLKSFITVVFGITFIVVSASNLAFASRSETDLPPNLRSCLGIDQAKPATVIAKTTEAQITYYRVLVSEQYGQISTPFAAYSPEQACTPLINLEQSRTEASSIQKFVSSESTAQNLALQELDWFIARAGGKEKYQQALLQSLEAPDEYHYFFPEELWSFEQRGITPPKDYVLLDPQQTLSANE